MKNVLSSLGFLRTIISASVLIALLINTVPVLANSSTPVELDFPEPTETPEPGKYPAFYNVPLALAPHDHFLLTRPLIIEEVSWPTADFRYGFFDTKTNSLHTGIDLVSEIGEPVLAAGDGEVIFSGYGLIKGSFDPEDPYGIAVMIKHSFGFEGNTLYTVYGHLQKSLVKDGQMVKAGEPIGTVGITGNTSGPHLHFEVRLQDGQDAVVQNPELWLAPPLGYGVLAGRIQTEGGYFLPSKNFTLKSLETGKIWKITTYSQNLIDRHLNDDFFKENFVLYDLPEGKYEISTYYYYGLYKAEIDIAPGAINFITFRGSQGFVFGYPVINDPANFLQ